MTRPNFANYTPGIFGEGMRVEVRLDQHRGYKQPLDPDYEVDDVEPSAEAYWSNVKERHNDKTWSE